MRTVAAWRRTVVTTTAKTAAGIAIVAVVEGPQNQWPSSREQEELTSIARLRELLERLLSWRGSRVTVGTWIETATGWAVNRALVVAVATLTLTACGSAPATSDYDEVTESGSLGDAEAEREDFDEDAARDRAEEEVASEGYHGPCTQDCGGHDAGFSWAADGNPDGGTSTSQSFDEGQQAYEDAVEERIEDQRQAYEDGDAMDY